MDIRELSDRDLAAAMQDAAEWGDMDTLEALAAEQADRLTTDGARLDAYIANLYT